MTSKCKTCGHSELHHVRDGVGRRKYQKASKRRVCDVKYCDCQKFSPEDDPLDEIFVEKITVKELKDLKEENSLLKEGISDEIDNLKEDIKKLKKRNEFLEKQAIDFQRVFNDDREIFKEQLEEIKQLKLFLSDEVRT